jgi:O-antigen ligase
MAFKSAAATLARQPSSLAPPAAVLALGVLIGALSILAASGRTVALLLVLVVLAPILALAVRRPERILLAFLIVDVPLSWDFNLDYRKALAKLGSIGGLDVSLTTLALVGLYSIWLAQSLVRRKGIPPLQLRLAAPLLALLTFTVLSVGVAHDRTSSVFEIWLLVQTTLLFVYIASRLRSNGDFEFAATAMAFGLLFEGLIMLAQRYAHLHLDIAGLSTAEGPHRDGVTDISGSRVGGTLGSPNAAGGYLALSIVPVIMLLATPVRPWRKVVAVAAAGLGLLALIVTFSRGGWLSLVISVLVLLVLAARGGRIRPAVPITLAAALATTFIVFHGPISHRLNGNDRGSAASRVPLMHLAEDMIKSDPLLGVGANNFATRIPDFAGPEFSRDWIYTVHNKYLLLWAEAGIGALLAFLWFIGSSIRRGFAASRDTDPLLAPLAAGLTAGLAGQLADMFVEPFHSRPEVQGLVLVAAIVTAMYATVRARAAQPAEETPSATVRALIPRHFTTSTRGS